LYFTAFVAAKSYNITTSLSSSWNTVCHPVKLVT